MATIDETKSFIIAKYAPNYVCHATITKKERNMITVRTVLSPLVLLSHEEDTQTWGLKADTISQPHSKMVTNFGPRARTLFGPGDHEGQVGFNLIRS